MTVDIPSTVPPASIQDKVLPILLSHLKATSKSSPASTNEFISILTPVLHILASIQLSSTTSPDNKSSPVPLLPLKTLLNISKDHSTVLTLPILLDTVLAYPHHLSAIHTIFDNYISADPSILNIIKNVLLPSLAARLWDAKNKSITEIGGVVRLLWALARGHEKIREVIKEKGDIVFPALRVAYSQLIKINVVSQKNGNAGDEEMVVIAVKSEILLLVHSILDGIQDTSTKDIFFKYLSEDGHRSDQLNSRNGLGGTLLFDQNLRGDYEAIFGVTRRSIGSRQMEILKSIRQRDAINDPRLKPLNHLFPNLPTSLLLGALAHPKFSSVSSTSRQSPEEAVAPLIDAILSGGSSLPDDLWELREVVQRDANVQSAQQDSFNSTMPPTQEQSGTGTKLSDERRNIWNTEDLDISKLRLGKDETALPQIASAIPDHLRASILRLVESQAEEEEAQRKALLEAHGSSADPYGLGTSRIDRGGSGVGTPKKRRAPVAAVSGGIDTDDDEPPDGAVKIVGGGDESDLDAGGFDSDLDDDDRSIQSASPPPGMNPTRSSAQLQIQAKLELLYLSDPKVFDRDSETRRSKPRQELREATGMDDSQLEGWRTMLERNPHKEAILARHQWTDKTVDQKNDGSKKNSREGSGGGDGGESSSGGGQRGGGRGGRGGGTNGRGRGRGASKGSRGHSNAARTRGHDKKMTRMGAGL